MFIGNFKSNQFGPFNRLLMILIIGTIAVFIGIANCEQVKINYDINEHALTWTFSVEENQPTNDMNNLCYNVTLKTDEKYSSQSIYKNQYLNELKIKIDGIEYDTKYTILLMDCESQFLGQQSVMMQRSNSENARENNGMNDKFSPANSEPTMHELHQMEIDEGDQNNVNSVKNDDPIDSAEEFDEKSKWHLIIALSISASVLILIILALLIICYLQTEPCFGARFRNKNMMRKKKQPKRTITPPNFFSNDTHLTPNVNNDNESLLTNNHHNHNNSNSFIWASPNASPVDKWDHIDREFEMLNDVCCKYKQAKLALESENNELMKYHAVVPYEHSLVRIAMNDRIFINASHIKGFEAIASETPFSPSTLANTLIMMVENKISCVVDLSQVPNDCFWSMLEVNNSYRFQLNTEDKSFELRLRKKVEYLYFDYFTYCLTIDGVDYQFSRVHFKIHFDPNEPLKIFAFINLALFVAHTTKSHHKIVVQCSDGSGRSGVLIVALKVIKDIIKINTKNNYGEVLALNQGQSINITKIVYDARKSRSEIVRSQQQYRFLYTVLNELVQFSGTFFDDLNSLRTVNDHTLYSQFRIIDDFKLNNANGITCHNTSLVGQILNSTIQIMPSFVKQHLFALNYLPQAPNELRDNCHFIWDQKINVLVTFVAQDFDKDGMVNPVFGSALNGNVNVGSEFAVKATTTNQIGERIMCRKLVLQNLMNSCHGEHCIQQYLVKDLSARTMNEVRSIIDGKILEYDIQNRFKDIILVQQSANLKENLNICLLFVLYYSSIQKLKVQGCLSLCEHFKWAICHSNSSSMNLDMLKQLVLLLTEYWD